MFVLAATSLHAPRLILPMLASTSCYRDDPPPPPSPKMAANRKGIGLTTLNVHATSQLAHTPSSYAQNTLQRLANLRPEGERDCLIVLQLSEFLFHCNSQTTQATELTQTRIQNNRFAYTTIFIIISRKTHNTYDSSFQTLFNWI